MHYSEFGYDNYDEYLNGKEWHEIKDFYYKHIKPYKCGICKQHIKLLLHKRNYAHLSLKSLRRKYVLNFLIVRYLRKNMVYLCHKHNSMIHFYDNGSRVPLVYKDLVAREQYIKWRENSWWTKFKRLKPSQVFEWIGKAYKI
jgi:hypothetical protein